MNYPFVVTPEESGGWSIRFPDLPGATGFVERLEDIASEVAAVQEFWLADVVAEGRPVPEPTSDWDPIGRRASDINVDHVYTTREAAELLGVTPRRVNALASARGLGALIGRVKVFTGSEIENMKSRINGRPRAS